MIENLEHPPFLQNSGQLGANSSERFKSFSVGGFLRINGKVEGFEIQCMPESVGNWKRGDDHFYKVRSAIDAWIRPDKCCPIADIYNIWSAQKALL